MIFCAAYGTVRFPRVYRLAKRQENRRFKPYGKASDTAAQARVLSNRQKHAKAGIKRSGCASEHAAIDKQRRIRYNGDAASSVRTQDSISRPFPRGDAVCSVRTQESFAGLFSERQCCMLWAKYSLQPPELHGSFQKARLSLGSWELLFENLRILTVLGGFAMKQCMDADNLHRRLKKIIGQVQAIDRMVDEDVPCEDILAQIHAAKAALHKAGQVVLEGHIRHCVRDGIANGDAEKTIESFTKAVERFANMQ